MTRAELEAAMHAMLNMPPAPTVIHPRLYERLLADEVLRREVGLVERDGVLYRGRPQ